MPEMKADMSLFSTNVHRKAARNMQAVTDFESVELGEFDHRDEEQKRMEKVPRRVIHFSSGETMEEYSTDEDEDEEPEKKDLLSPPMDGVKSRMTWGPYVLFHMLRAAHTTVSACDYVGERMASLFGLTSAKYQYAIDEYYRTKKKREEEEEDDRLSEEAERSFIQHCDQENKRMMKKTSDRETSKATARVEVAYEVEDEHQSSSHTTRVPAIVMAT